MLDETLMSELFGIDYPMENFPVVEQHTKKSDIQPKLAKSREIDNSLFMDIFGVNSTDKIVMPIKEKVIQRHSTPPHADFPPYRHKETFSIEADMKAYEERMRRGKLKLKTILSALVDNKKAYNYVELYFETDPVQWSVKKFKKYLNENIAYWTEKRKKYGDKGIANYSESIQTNELILRTLDELDNKLMEIDSLAA